MDEAAPPPSCDQPGRTAVLTCAKAAQILWECAWDALVLAFLVLIFGSIMLGLVGGIWQQMTPSLPPGLARKPLPEAEASSTWDFSFFHQHRLALLFGIIFACEGAARLVRYSRNGEPGNGAGSLRRVTRRLARQWFRLVVRNAFIVFVTVLVLQAVQQFSLSRWLWHALIDLCRPMIDAMAALFPRAFGTLAGLVWWFNENQLKFTFWLLYSAAICDDLGLPNYKALARYLWRRLLRRYAPALSTGPPRLSGPN